mgnify:CR=1 FL=1
MNEKSQRPAKADGQAGDRRNASASSQLRDDKVVRQPPSAYLLDEQIGYRLRVANQIAVELFSDVLDPAFGEETVTTAQFAVLVSLLRNARVSQSELSSAVSMDMPTLNGVLKRLVARGLVEVTVAKADKRFRVIDLTPPGRLLAGRLRSKGRVVSERIMQPLGDSERRQLLDLLSKLIHAHRAD